MPSERTKKSKKMMLSSAGCEPDDAKLIFIRPEKPAPLTELIAIWSSLVTNPQASESITNVNEPVALSRFVIVSGIAVGVGV
jgi:hypothetical protein